MVQIDFKADIVPGKSLAGVDVGTRFDQLDLNNIEITTLKKEDISKGYGWLHNAVLQHQNLLVIDENSLPYTLYLGGYKLRVDFGSSSEVVRIVAMGGYVGSLFEKIKIGSLLAELQNYCEFEFDEFEDTHFPTSSEKDMDGIEFQSSETCSFDLNPDQTITGIIVFSKEELTN